VRGCFEYVNKFLNFIEGWEFLRYLNLDDWLESNKSGNKHSEYRTWTKSNISLDCAVVLVADWSAVYVSVGLPWSEGRSCEGRWQLQGQHTQSAHHLL
jgi:hypothetical protein